MKGLRCLGVFALLIGASLSAQAPVPPAIRIFLIERPVGWERTTVTTSDGARVVTSTVEFVDRGTPISLNAMLTMDADGAPVRFQSKGRSYRFVNVDVDVTAPEGDAPWFPARTWAPVTSRAALIAYWQRRGRPPAIRLVPGDADSHIGISERGDDVVTVGGRQVRLRRYSVDGVVWGRETVWLDQQGAFAALVSRVHILPLEAVREDLVDALPALQASSIRDRIEDLEDFRATMPTTPAGPYALEGVRIITDPETEPIEDGVVVIDGGTIVAVGPRASTGVPSGTRIMRMSGLTVMPGLWDMHAHASQIEWGPAYLAAGVTTVRDMGGEAAFLTAFRDSVASGRGLGPTLELAGLVDGPGDRGFGTVIASTSDEGRAVVDRYVAAGFRQIKVYSLLQPPVVAAIAARAHERGITVTGHVPSAMNADAAVRAGMDHIAHLPGNLSIELAAERQTVVDPTQAWGELLGRPSNVEATAIEPGLAHAPYPLAENYRSVNNAPRSTPAAGPSRGAQQLKALVDRGVPIVAGTDGAVPGHSLLRELELYVAAGMTPAQALRTATTHAARALGREKQVGHIAPGMRADLVVVDGHPLQDIGAIRRIRHVISRGVLYEPARLWRLAGFR